MMKTWLKRTLLGVAVSTALLGSLAAYSQGVGFHHGPPSPEQMAQHEAMMLAHIGKKLNLDANQAAKLKALADLMHGEHAPPAAGTDPHAAMTALIAGNTFDRAGAQAAGQQARRQDPGQQPRADHRRRRLLRQPQRHAAAQVREFAAKHHGFFGLGGFGPGGDARPPRPARPARRLGPRRQLKAARAAGALPAVASTRQRPPRLLPRSRFGPTIAACAAS